ncbi:28 kDa heat- and acid-stable phosphoprotein [Frankliniella fusca]|uniref:28 kDa heat- and acid-stable phosphoprotein n=1 Tax=Frankliniella fusca TaxID=407009 RepID=A0AAE1HB58_9NEOP|nr:28 kDa heat- and acid-stable phosphoprotein [Frankliniella fusca]
MPKGRGKFINHKGKHRSFTNPDELEEQRKREEKERQWRAERGEVSSSEEEEDDEKKGSDESDSEEESSSEEEDEGKAKGVEGLIQVENPNRVQNKAKKLSTLNTELSASTSTKPELSRREREELEKQRAAANYQRLHAKGKTEEARADLARLAIIKAQREEAAKKRAEDAKMKEVEAQKKKQATQKALGKKV